MQNTVPSILDEILEKLRVNSQNILKVSYD